MKTTCFILLLITVPMALTIRVFGQDAPLPPRPDTLAADTSAVTTTASPRPTIPPDKLLYHENKGFFQSPTGTLLKSVIIPGWGQWSNGKKQKAGIYAGIEAYFFTKAMIWRGRASDRLHAWETSCDSEGGCDAALFSSFDSARGSRNYFYWLLGTTIFVSMFDAYADRYLLTLEQTRDKGDNFWGGQTALPSAEEWRVVATIKF